MRYYWWTRICLFSIFLPLHFVSISANQRYFGSEQELITTFVLRTEPTSTAARKTLHSCWKHLSSTKMIFEIKVDAADEKSDNGENGVSTLQLHSSREESSNKTDNAEASKSSAEVTTSTVGREAKSTTSVSVETEKEEKGSSKKSTEAKAPTASYNLWSSLNFRGGARKEKEGDQETQSISQTSASDDEKKTPSTGNPDQTVGNKDESKSSAIPKRGEEKGSSKNESSGENPPGVDSCIWSGEEKSAFSDLSHPGYSVKSDPLTHVGGWLAHRAALQSVDNIDPPCWIKEEVENSITQYDYMTMPLSRAPKILVLYGSLRPTSFSRKLAFEFARLLELLGCDVRTYNPRGLPVRDPALEKELKVQELRALTHWSDGHVWVSPEMHGTITGTFKNQIDWIPLNTGSVRPTQGKTCLVAQANGGSQSFNAINALRLLARWMRMPCCTNQSSVPKAWQEFDDAGRMKESNYRDRVVDCAEEFAKFTAIMAPVSEELTDRFSERKERNKEGRLLTQEEKEKKKTVEESKKG